MSKAIKTKILVPERVALAKEKTQRLVDNARHLLRLRSTNEILLHSDRLSKQVPVSYAANAFNVLVQAMHENELTRLCALWDTVRDDQNIRARDSIPAVVWLVDHPDVESHLCKETYDHFAVGFQSPPEDSNPDMKEAIEAAYESVRSAVGEQEAAKVSRWLVEAKESCETTNTGDVLQSVRDYRDKNIAHVLSPMFTKPKAQERKARYGDEKELFIITIKVIEKLHLAVNGAGFMWDEAADQERRDAEALWHGVTIEVLE